MGQAALVNNQDLATQVLAQHQSQQQQQQCPHNQQSPSFLSGPPGHPAARHVEEEHSSGRGKEPTLLRPRDATYRDVPRKQQLIRSNLKQSILVFSMTRKEHNLRPLMTMV